MSNDRGLENGSVSSPEVTVVLTCYSYRTYFLPAFMSIQNQTARNKIEFLIHDNGCKKEYRALIQETANKFGVRVITDVVNTYGLGFRLNVLPQIKTPYLAILHDDDEYLPKKIEESLHALQSKSLDYIVTSKLFIDKRGKLFVPHGMEEVNPYCLTGKEHASTLLVDMLRPPGLRLHFSTLVIKTSVAQKNLLGDPFYPRISDAFFWASLLVDESLKSEILPEKLTKIRIHGMNDQVYQKFDPLTHTTQNYLLSLSETRLFQMMIEKASTPLLVRMLQEFAGITERGDDRVHALVEAAIALRDRINFYPKAMMAMTAFHAAFALEPQRSLALLHELVNEDANSFMAHGYKRVFKSYIDMTSAYHYAVLRRPPLWQRLAVKLIWNPFVLALGVFLPRRSYVRLRRWYRYRKNPQLAYDEIAAEAELELKKIGTEARTKMEVDSTSTLESSI